MTPSYGPSLAYYIHHRRSIRVVHVIDVVLPEGEWLEAFVVARAIGTTLYPAADAIEGVDLVQSKMLIRDGVPRLPLLLSDADKDQLANLLPLLPRLVGTMSEAEMDAFIAAFRDLPDDVRPDWEPCLPSPSDLYVRTTVMSYDASADHMTKLAGQVDQGRVRAMNLPHRSDGQFGPRTLLHRNDVMTYLKDRGLARIGEQEAGMQVVLPEPPPSAADLVARVAKLEDLAKVAPSPQVQPDTSSEASQEAPKAHSYAQRLSDAILEDSTRSPIARLIADAVLAADDPRKPASVWVQLCSIARDQKPTSLEFVSDKELKQPSGTNGWKPYSQEALGKFLRRYKPQTGS